MAQITMHRQTIRHRPEVAVCRLPFVATALVAASTALAGVTPGALAVAATEAKAQGFDVQADDPEIAKFIAIDRASPTVRARIDAPYAHDATLHALPRLP